MSEVKVIRRRLLIDGYGTGDDTRLTNLIKSVVKWTNSTEQSQEENEQMYNSLLAQLSQCEYTTRKSQILAASNKKQLEKYGEMHEFLDAKVRECKDTIAESKILKNKQLQYNLLAQRINEQPDAADTDKKLSSVNAQLNQLHEESRDVDQKLDMRRKQFHVLIARVNQLQAIQEDVSHGVEINTSDDITNCPEPVPMSE